MLSKAHSLKASGLKVLTLPLWIAFYGIFTIILIAEKLKEHRHVVVMERALNDLDYDALLHQIRREVGPRSQY
jgi:hypothetical protein